MKRLFIVALFGCFMLAGLQTKAQVVVKVKPNRPKVVVVKPAKQKKRHVWVDGHWHWSKKKQKYVWKKGHWKKRKKGHHWVPGHWVSTGNGHKWVPGHWKK